MLLGQRRRRWRKLQRQQCKLQQLLGGAEAASSASTVGPCCCVASSGRGVVRQRGRAPWSRCLAASPLGQCKAKRAEHVSEHPETGRVVIKYRHRHVGPRLCVQSVNSSTSCNYVPGRCLVHPIHVWMRMNTRARDEGGRPYHFLARSRMESCPLSRQWWANKSAPLRLLSDDGVRLPNERGRY